jgi:SAM-dependent methyltransferase
MANILDVQQYWDRRPCNIRHSPAPLGSAEYFDQVEERKYFVEPHIPSFADFPRWAGKDVLEIGCGIGTDSINFVRHRANLDIAELSPESLALTKKRFEVYGLKANFYNGNAEQLDQLLPEGKKYDLVYSFGVIHHTPNPERVIADVKRRLKPGGELRIMLYSRYCWKVFWIYLRYGWREPWNVSRIVAKYSEAQTGSPVTYVYSFSQVRKLLAGFEIERMWKDHIFPYRIADYVQYRYVKNWYFRWMPESWFRALERKWGWHLMVVAKLPKQPAGAWPGSAVDA